MDKRFTPVEIFHRFAMLEHYLHRQYIGDYQVSESFNTQDPVSVHREASRMLLFSGLIGYSPLIEFANLPPSKAGDVNLNNDPNDRTLHIRLDYTARTYPKRALAILAHEVCHKVLQYYGFPILSGIENEYYTDLATFYIGLGELTKAGKVVSYQDGNISRTSTVGYLSEACVADAFYIVNNTYHGRTNFLGRLFEDSASADAQTLIRKTSKLPHVKRGETTIYFEKLFVVKCPNCQYSSEKYTPGLYLKKVSCPRCKDQFVYSEVLRNITA